MLHADRLTLQNSPDVVSSAQKKISLINSVVKGFRFSEKKWSPVDLRHAKREKAVRLATAD